MKCTTFMCGEFTLWRCPQIIPCNPTWQQRAFGFYKTGTGKNLFCYKCCVERDDWRAWSLAERQEAIDNKYCCRHCIEAGAAYIQSLSPCIPTEPSSTSSVATLSAPPAAASGAAIPPPPPQTLPASPRPYHNGFANYSHALPAPPAAVSGVAIPLPPPQTLPASTPPPPSPLAPVALYTPSSVARRVVVKPYNGLEFDDSRGQIEDGYLQVSVGDEVDVLCATIPGHQGNSFDEYTYVWNGRVGGFGWIPTMVLSTTAVLTTNEGTLPGPIPADDGRVFALSLQ